MSDKAGFLTRRTAPTSTPTCRRRTMNSRAWARRRRVVNTCGRLEEAGPRGRRSDRHEALVGEDARPLRPYGDARHPSRRRSERAHIFEALARFKASGDVTGDLDLDRIIDMSAVKAAGEVLGPARP